jgi:hypothetical protein
MPKRDQIRVSVLTRWALKVASSRLDISIVELLSRVEHGDNEALQVWRDAVEELSND